MSSRLLAAVATLALAVAADAYAAANPKDVAEAERAFAADGRAVGIKRSFLKHMADDAVVFAPDPVNAKTFYSAQPGDKEPPLFWWPMVAAISRSGDLGFSLGPYELNGKRGGHYFTIWRKGEDGVWKWVYDGGQQNDASASPAEGGKVRYFPTNSIPTVSGDQFRPASTGRYASDGAMSDVEGAESDLAEIARYDLHQAYSERLAPDAVVMGSPAAPAMTPAAVTAELKTRYSRVNFARLGGGVAEAGDFAWTYGTANWTKAGKKHRGHYVRVWQKRTNGWRIIFDELLEVV